MYLFICFGFFAYNMETKSIFTIYSGILYILPGCKKNYCSEENPLVLLHFWHNFYLNMFACGEVQMDTQTTVVCKGNFKPCVLLSTNSMKCALSRWKLLWIGLFLPENAVLSIIKLLSWPHHSDNKSLLTCLSEWYSSIFQPSILELRVLTFSLITR